MDGARFRECLKITRRSRRGFGREVGAGANIVDLWALDRISIPPLIAAFLDREARQWDVWRKRNPAPQPGEWRRRDSAGRRRAA